jgi:MYXO-CTERM domain-containing protein
VAIHEFGHTFAGLADEYESAYPGYPQCGADCPEPNATNHNVREEIKWNIWIDAATPVPTPEANPYLSVIGVFEGCRYMSSGVYRPKNNCEMRSLGPQFCSVCSEATLLQIYREVDPIDAVDPASPVSLTSCDSETLSVDYIMPIPDTVMVSWYVDGQLEATGSAQYTVEAIVLGDGSHTVRADVVDESILVRNDPSNLLTDSYSWTVDVSGSGSGACLIGAICYSGGAAEPNTRCQECQPGVDPSDWTADDSNDCSDGVFCNGLESCSGGACQAGAAACTDDGLACTATCDEASDQCDVLDAGFCLIAGGCEALGTIEPGNPCRECQPGIIPTDWSADDSNDCSDAVFCNGAETCQAGVCQAGVAPCSDDGLACTDLCDENSGACNTLQAGWCVIAGACVADGTLDPNNSCQACNSALDPAGWLADDALGCSDNLFCNGTETCQTGVCQAGAAPCADDGLTCTDTCVEDGDTCNVLQAGFCAIAGACAAEGEADPDNPCAECQTALDDSAYTPDDSNACDDGRECTGSDRCEAGTCTGDLIAGCCVLDVDCDDGLACTDDVCDAVASTCANDLQAGQCLIDGACYEDGDVDQDNRCVACLADVDSAAWTDLSGVACDDGDNCTSGETCQAGSCSGGQQVCSADCPCDVDGGTEGGGGDGDGGIKGGCGCASETGHDFGWGLLGLAGVWSLTRLRRRRML